MTSVPRAGLSPVPDIALEDKAPVAWPGFLFVGFDPGFTRKFPVLTFSVLELHFKHAFS